MRVKGAGEGERRTGQFFTVHSQAYGVFVDTHETILRPMPVLSIC